MWTAYMLGIVFGFLWGFFVGNIHKKTPCPIPMILVCPMCQSRHIDIGEFATKSHHTHACQQCGNVWRPAIVPTVGVRYLPGFKN